LIIAGEPCIKTITPRAPLMYLSSEKKTLRRQLCSIPYAAVPYAAVRINNCLKRTFVIKVFVFPRLDVMPLPTTPSTDSTIAGQNWNKNRKVNRKRLLKQKSQYEPLLSAARRQMLYASNSSAAPDG